MGWSNSGFDETTFTYIDDFVISDSFIPSPPSANPGTVTDLSVISVDNNSVTLSFTEADNGQGNPASYDVRFAKGTISWGSAASVTSGTCSTPVLGNTIGAKINCNVTNLEPATDYQFQLIAFRGTLNVDAVFGGLSNIASATTTGTVPPPAPVNQVDVTPVSASISVGGTVQLTATPRDSSGNPLSGRTVSWSSSDSSIATVDQSGLVTAVAADSATISATSEGISGTAVVTVTDGSVTIYFQDNFESGDLSKPGWGSSNGMSDSIPVVSPDIARNGTFSLKFTFIGNASGDAWSEQRFGFGEQLTEVYLQWYQYFPNGTEGLGAKYKHRFVTGPDNNKFLRLWDASYRDYKVKLGWSLDSTGNPEVEAMITEYGVNGSNFGKHGNGWRTPTDESLLGRWVRFQVHVKLATVANNDGVMEMWVDGVKVIENTTFPIYPSGGIGNYLANGYFMGWSNSGFDETTFTYIDDFVISDSFIP